MNILKGNSDFKKHFENSIRVWLSINTIAFWFFSDSLFGRIVILPNQSMDINVLCNKVLFSVTFLLVTAVIMAVYLCKRKHLIISGRDYSIDITYGDIFEMGKCKKIIPFDECFTDSVGDKPEDINPDSICGQFLLKNPSIDIKKLIMDANVVKTGQSEYLGRDKYESGKLLVNGEYLLMAFAKLDKQGLGCITYADYLRCLSVLWEEIDKYYNQNDICIPIIGSGVTRFKDITLDKQELLDVIISSYRLNKKKIHKPNKLIIVCNKDISLNKVGNYC